MIYKAILVITIFLFGSIQAFTSLYLPSYKIKIHCSQVLHKKAFDICYNYQYKHPNMVVYKVYGDLVNKNNYSRKHIYFRPDYSIPTKYRSYPRDYSKTGYDRGHNAPNSIFDYDKKIQKETFLMSNITPQAPKINRILWRKIERFVKFQAIKHKEISVITGSCKSKGKIRHNVNIPQYLYKILFIKNKVISFLVPNNNYLYKQPLKTFLTDIENIEEICNFHLSPTSR